MISVESIQASRANNVPIHTLVCEFPLTILNQLLTHRAFSRNSSSARAVPVEKAINQLLDSPAEPIWTKKGKGMSGDLITDSTHLATLNAMHEHFLVNAASAADVMDTLGVHKQNAGRYLTPFQNCRIVLTATDWANWDWLRMDAAAQPEIQELATKIYEARMNAEIMDLEYGEYHVPFIKRHRAVNGELEYFVETEEGFVGVCLDHAIKVSMSACAQTSYRKLDTSIEKADSIIPKLFDGDKVHASPSEHQATPMQEDMVSVIGKAASGKETGASLTDALVNLPAGVTAINVDGTVASGNFTNWIQHRQLLPNHDGGVGEHVPEATCTETCTCDEESTVDLPEGNAMPTPEEFEKLSSEEQDAAMKAILKEITDEISKAVKNS